MTDFCINFLELLKSWIMKLPDLSIESTYLSNMVSGMHTVVDFLAFVNFIIPLDTILLIMSIVYGFKVVKFMVFLINWVVRRIADFFP